MRIIQVTLGASRAQFTTAQLYTPYMVIQNNGGSAIRIGDNTVTSSKGQSIAANGGQLIIQRNDNRIPVFNYYAQAGAGTLDVLYE